MKIGFAGTVSVGKTTFVNYLKENTDLGFEFIVERSKYLMEMGIPLNTDSTLKGQCIFLAERVSELYKDSVITDRSIIDVMAFTNLAKSIKPFEKDDFETNASNLLGEYDIIFYVSPYGVDIENNGIRETDKDYRLSIDKEINRLLVKYRHKIKNVYSLEGSNVERYETFLNAYNDCIKK